MQKSYHRALSKAVSVFRHFSLIVPLPLAVLPLHSAHSQFATVLNIPPDPNIGEDETIGSDTQLNLGEGGSIGYGFTAGNSDGSSSNIEINIAGGTVDDFFTLNRGSEVNISGGIVGVDVGTTLNNKGGIVNISDGVVNGFVRSQGGKLNITGGTIGANRVFDEISALASDVNISGGRIETLVTRSGTVDISGGEINGFSSTDSLVNITGGTMGPIYSFGSRITIRGGVILREQDPLSPAFTRGALQVVSGSSAKIYGGMIDDGFRNSGRTEIFGGEFYLDDSPVEGLDSIGNSVDVQVPNNSVLSGTFSDGTPFAFVSLNPGDLPDEFLFGTLTLTATDTPIASQSGIHLPGDEVPQGIRPGQILNVKSGAVVADNFNIAMGSKLIMSGGQIGDNLEIVGTEATITGGSIGDGFDAFVNSTVNLHGGAIGDNFELADGSVLNMFNGTLGDDFLALEGAVVNIHGGSVGQRFELLPGSIANISGGTFGDAFRALNRSELNFRGRKFIVDGEDITDLLTPGVPFTVPVHEESFRGVLADGTPFDFDFTRGTGHPNDNIATFATLNVTLVPEPASVWLMLFTGMAVLAQRIHRVYY